VRLFARMRVLMACKSENGCVVCLVSVRDKLHTISPLSMMIRLLSAGSRRGSADPTQEHCSDILIDQLLCVTQVPF